MKHINNTLLENNYFERWVHLCVNIDPCESLQVLAYLLSSLKLRKFFSDWYINSTNADESYLYAILRKTYFVFVAVVVRKLFTF